MRFRRIYWVTEHVKGNGSSEVTGIFTSIPDLIEIGLSAENERNHEEGLRLTLCELDSVLPPLCVFGPKEFNDVEKMLKDIVEGGELTHENVVWLCSALEKVAKSAAG